MSICFALDNSDNVRYFGVDAPETGLQINQPDNIGVELESLSHLAFQAVKGETSESNLFVTFE
jgi:hypothetical protein